MPVSYNALCCEPDDTYTKVANDIDDTIVERLGEMRHWALNNVGEGDVVESQNAIEELTELQEDLERLHKDIAHLWQEIHAHDPAILHSNISTMRRCQRTLSRFPEVQAHGLADLAEEPMDELDSPEEHADTSASLHMELLAEAFEKAGLYHDAVREDFSTDMTTTAMAGNIAHIIELLSNPVTTVESLSHDLEKLSPSWYTWFAREHGKLGLKLDQQYETFGAKASSVVKSVCAEMYSPEVHNVSSTTCRRAFQNIAASIWEFRMRHGLPELTTESIQEIESTDVSVEAQAWLQCVDDATIQLSEVEQAEVEVVWAEHKEIASQVKLLVNMFLEVREQGEADKVAQDAKIAAMERCDQIAQVTIIQNQLMMKDMAAAIDALKLQLRMRIGE